MGAFATADDLATYLLPRQIDSGQAALILDQVSDDIRADLGWSVTEESAQVLVTDGAGSTAVILPTLHLTAVSVIEDGVALVEGTDYIWDTTGIVTRVRSRYPMSWCTKLQSVQITYDHGYADADVPTVFKSVALEMASKQAGNPGNLITSRTVGQTAESYSIPNKLIHESPLSRLDRYRILDGVA